MNDTTILRNISVTGHGGFMAVLDPQGIVLTKSPYMQTGTSFSPSNNKKRFAGGMFIDGFVGNLRTRVTGINNAFSLNVESQLGEGLRIRKPQVPCPFYIQGKRYQVNAFTNYDQQAGTATMLLDPTSMVVMDLVIRFQQILHYKLLVTEVCWQTTLHRLTT